MKKSWGDRFKMVKSAEPAPAPAPSRHSDPYLLQEYRDKYGSLSAGSALKKSMRYAEPWLYPSGAPNFCTCPDAISTTSRKSKSECSRCGGCRWPSLGGGTVRLPVRASPQAPVFGGTVRQPRARPSIESLVDGDDPYGVMRRNRLTGRHPRAKSSSPARASWPEEASHRKSILECEVNAYELIAKYLKNNQEPDDLSDNEVESGVTTISGQRIRMPSASVVASSRTVDFVVDPEEGGRKQPKRPQRRAKAKIKSILKKPREGEPAEGRPSSVSRLPASAAAAAAAAAPRTTFQRTFESSSWPEQAAPSLPSFAEYRAQRRKKQVQFNVVSDEEETTDKVSSGKPKVKESVVLVTDRGKKEPPPRPPPPIKTPPPPTTPASPPKSQVEQPQPQPQLQQQLQQKTAKDEQKTYAETPGESPSSSTLKLKLTY